MDELALKLLQLQAHAGEQIVVCETNNFKHLLLNLHHDEIRLCAYLPPQLPLVDEPTSLRIDQELLVYVEVLFNLLLEQEVLLVLQ